MGNKVRGEPALDGNLCATWWESVPQEVALFAFLVLVALCYPLGGVAGSGCMRSDAMGKTKGKGETRLRSVRNQK